MDQYFLANDIVDEKKKVAVFSTVIGGETYSLLRNLVAPAKPAIQSLADLTNVLKKHLNPTPIVIAERYKFYDRCQKEDETLSEFIASLRKLSAHCIFNDFLEQALRDKYVCGLRSRPIRKRLLAERNLNLQKALELSQVWNRPHLKVY